MNKNENDKLQLATNSKVPFSALTVGWQQGYRTCKENSSCNPQKFSLETE